MNTSTNYLAIPELRRESLDWAVIGSLTSLAQASVTPEKFVTLAENIPNVRLAKLPERRSDQRYRLDIWSCGSKLGSLDFFTAAAVFIAAEVALIAYARVQASTYRPAWTRQGDELAVHNGVGLTSDVGCYITVV